LFICILTFLNVSIIAIYSIAMYFIYKYKWPFFEQYRISQVKFHDSKGTLALVNWLLIMEKTTHTFNKINCNKCSGYWSNTGYNWLVYWFSSTNENVRNSRIKIHIFLAISLFFDCWRNLELHHALLASSKEIVLDS
jgi:hypothetical protein